MSTSTEQKIIDNAIQMIDHDGYQNLSLRKLAKQSNMTTGAFYNHFKNEDELFYRGSLVLSKKVVDYLDVTNDDAFDQLLKIAQGFCELFRTSSNQIDFLFFNPIVISAYQHANQDFLFLTMTRNLAFQVNPGKLPNEDFFNQIWSFIQGYAFLIKNQVTNYDPDLVKTPLLELTGEENWKF